MIKKETTTTQKITVKGRILAIDDQGVHVEDSKTFEISVITLELFREFMNKDFSLTLSDKIVETEILEEIEPVEEEEEDED